MYSFGQSRMGQWILGMERMTEGQTKTNKQTLCDLVCLVILLLQGLPPASGSSLLVYKFRALFVFFVSQLSSNVCFPVT